MNDKQLLVARGQIAMHVSVGIDDAPRLLEALSKSPLSDDQLIIAIRKRMASLLEQGGKKP